MIPLNQKNDLRLWLPLPLGRQDPWTRSSLPLQEDKGERELCDLPLNFSFQADLLYEFDPNF